MLNRISISANNNAYRNKYLNMKPTKPRIGAVDVTDVKIEKTSIIIRNIPVLDTDNVMDNNPTEASIESSVETESVLSLVEFLSIYKM